MKPVIDVVIVNWNSGELLRRCLTSLDASNAGEINKVIVIDNGSEDSSRVHALDSRDRSFQLSLIANERNEGFSKACNQGAKCCSADFILFLNPDCELYPETIASVLRELAELPLNEYGAFGVALIGPEGDLARHCARQPVALDYWVKLTGMDRLTAGRVRSHIMSEWPHTESRDVEHVIGAFYLVRRTIFQAIGGFDERFFVYLEDLDLSRRILRAGYRIRYLSGAKAFHVGGGTSRKAKARRLYYSLKSRLLFAFKHFSSTGAWILLAGTVLLEPVIRFAYNVARTDFREATETVRAYRMLWSDLPRLLISRGRG
jgi:GT2 family glycosyltransferase